MNIDFNDPPEGFSFSVLDCTLMEACEYVLNRASRSALVRGDVSAVLRGWEIYEAACLRRAAAYEQEVVVDWISLNKEVQDARFSLRQSCAALATRLGHSRCHSLRERFLDGQPSVAGHQYDWFFN